MADITFGDQLLRFSHAVNSISQDGLSRLYDAARSYATRALAVSKVELLDEIPLRRGLGLQPTLDRSDKYPAYYIYDETGKPQGLNALAYDLETELWVTTPADAPRETALADVAPDAYQELWNRTHIKTEFNRLNPEDRGYRQEHTRTLISIPVFNSSKIRLGVVYFESGDRLEPTERVGVEFHKIARALGRLYELWDQEEARQNETSLAVNEVAESQSGYSFHYPYAPPLVFGIYPDKTDGTILKAIQEVVESGEFVWSSWEGMREDGLIPQQIEASLREAKYLVAYISEYEPTGPDNTFVDNPNVLYELGMFRGLLQDPAQPPTGAIFIREEKAPEVPFDLAAYRRVEVHRLGDGRIDYNQFKADFRDHFAALVS